LILAGWHSALAPTWRVIGGLNIVFAVHKIDQLQEIKPQTYINLTPKPAEINGQFLAWKHNY